MSWSQTVDKKAAFWIIFPSISVTLGWPPHCFGHFKCPELCKTTMYCYLVFIFWQLRLVYCSNFVLSLTSTCLFSDNQWYMSLFNRENRWKCCNLNSYGNCFQIWLLFICNLGPKDRCWDYPFPDEDEHGWCFQCNLLFSYCILIYHYSPCTCL